MQTVQQHDVRADGDEPKQISIIDIFILIGMRKWTFLSVSILGTALFLAVALTVPRYYVATTLMLIPQQQQQGGSALLLAQLGALAGVGGSGGVQASDELFASLLKSRKIKESLVDQFNLAARYESGSVVAAQDVLAQRTTLSLDKKTGLLTITVDDLESKVAAEIANAYVAQLQALLGKLAITQAQQRVAFLDQQVTAQRALVDEAERKFRTDLQTSGLSVADVEADSTVKASIELKTQIASAEVRLSSLRQFSTEGNMAVIKAKAELAALRRQLARLEQGSGDASDAQEKRPAATSYRDYKVRLSALDALVQQQELARIEAAREGPLLQQVDVAVPPERPTKPSRALIVIIGALVSMLVGAAVAMMLAGLQHADAGFKQKMARLRQLWW